MPKRLAKKTTYSYDAAGRRVSTERQLNPVAAGQAQAGQAQSLITHQRHDTADRIIAIAHLKRVGPAGTGTTSLIAGQAFTRAAGGAISRIDTYRLDPASPASSASYNSATGQFSGTASASASYEYDANARLTREVQTSGGINRVRHHFLQINRLKRSSAQHIAMLRLSQFLPTFMQKATRGETRILPHKSQTMLAS